MNEVEFILGEDRHIKLLVHSAKGDAFTVHQASWVLSELSRGEVEASGEGVIDGHTIDVKISPKKALGYRLTLTYTIADEVLKQHIRVTVK